MKQTMTPDLRERDVWLLVGKSRLDRNRTRTRPKSASCGAVEKMPDPKHGIRGMAGLCGARLRQSVKTARFHSLASDARRCGGSLQ